MNKKTPWHEKKGARVIISEKLQMTHAGVSQWIKRGVPPDRIIQLCEALDWEYSPHDINPDIYPNENDALPPKRRNKNG
jgi:DNA-binding transcriptional regulator YdaS (Cro superfamily)